MAKKKGKIYTAARRIQYNRRTCVRGQIVDGFDPKSRPGQSMIDLGWVVEGDLSEEAQEVEESDSSESSDDSDSSGESE